MTTIKTFRIFLFCLLWTSLSSGFLFANAFNELVQEKRILENQFNIDTLECFPFIKKIGFTDDQIPLVDQCLKGAFALKEAFGNVSHRDYKEVGVSNRFMRTGGFHTVLIDWKASPTSL